MLDELVVEYNKLQKKYGDPSLDSITFGGCKNNPDICSRKKKVQRHIHVLLQFFHYLQQI